MLLESGSQQFEQFLNLLGERVRLKGWKGYRAELDVENDSTGTHSVSTAYRGHDIMFHVSTLLPYSRVNQQQVNHERLI